MWISQDFRKAAVLCKKEISKGNISLDGDMVIAFFKAKDYYFKVFNNPIDIKAYISMSCIFRDSGRCLGCLAVGNDVGLYIYLNDMFHLIKENGDDD